jgi:hypothetical protein
LEASPLKEALVFRVAAGSPVAAAGAICHKLHHRLKQIPPDSLMNPYFSKGLDFALAGTGLAS